MAKNKPGYEYLITYQNAVAIFDLTQQFCEKFVNPRSRTFDQMVQAARSSKQCIPEGYLPKSLKGYFKLLGVTRGSFEELLQDLLDFARNRGVKIRDLPFIPLNTLINLPRRTNYLLDHQIKALEIKLHRLTSVVSSPLSAELKSAEAENCRIHPRAYARSLLRRRIKFIREGGYTENLFKKRLVFRNKI